MNQPPKTDKRIVSKGEYAVRKTFALSLSGGIVLCGIGIMLLLISLPVAFLLDGEPVRERVGRGEGFTLINYSGAAMAACICLIPFLFMVTIFLRSKSRKSWRAVDSMQPITRANAADLPAPDSLVRASAEPTQEQQAVLLRAATVGVEKYEEQLVRAAGGTE